MTTLILGHGRNYKKDFIRCSSYDVNKWYNTDYVCVDINPDANPDIVFDLRYDWSFCKNNSYHKIIDTTGLLFYTNDYKYRFKLMIYKKLSENGKFYGRHNAYWIKKSNNLYNIYTNKPIFDENELKNLINYKFNIF